VFHKRLCRAAHHGRLFDIWLSMNARIRLFIVELGEKICAQYELEG